MKIALPPKRLADNPRTHDLTVPLDQLPVGFRGKEHLRQAGDHQRINHAQDYRSHQREQHGYHQILFHDLPLDQV